MMARYKITRVGKDTYNIYRRHIGMIWQKIDSKPSWALAKRFVVSTIGESEFVYEELWKPKE